MALRSLHVAAGSARIQRVLELARQHLHLDAAYIAEIAEDQLVYRALSGAADTFGLELNRMTPVDGRFARRLFSESGDGMIDVGTPGPAPGQVTAGVHIVTPLLLSDGERYGALGCVGADSDPTLGDRDLAFLKLLAGIVTEDVEVEREIAAQRATVAGVLAANNVRMAYQPIIDLRTTHCLGVEALARFPSAFGGTAAVFAAAHQVDLGIALERLAVRTAIAEAVPVLGPKQFLSVNMSPAVVTKLASSAVTDGTLPMSRIVLEITENAVVDSYQVLRDELAPLREQGLRVAIDDAGAGYSSLHSVVELRPDIIKIDRSLVHGVSHDQARRVAISAFVLLGLDLDVTVVAEGVETRDDQSTLADLGVDAIQGFLLARPGPIDLSRPQAGLPERPPAHRSTS